MRQSLLTKHLCRSRIILLALLITVCGALSGCASKWELALSQGSEALPPVTANAWAEWAETFPQETHDGKALSLERVLWESGVVAVERIDVGSQNYAWEDIYLDSWLLKNGQVQIGKKVLKVDSIRVIPPPETAQVTAKLIDLAPTVANALGVDRPELTTGHPLGDYPADRVVFIFLDGFGYLRYQEIKDEGIAPFLDSLGIPMLALSVYPSITKAATAAMITGTTPERNGVRDRSKRATKAETILDTLARANKTSIAVEGDALAFNMPNAEIILSGDRDGNGYSDDNTFANAMTVIQDRMPDFLWIHFHGIDDVGHTCGPHTDQEVAKINEVDGYLEEIFRVLPPDSLVLICADHGMHSVNEGDRLGNHGSLLALDMFVPIWVLQI